MLTFALLIQKILDQKNVLYRHGVFIFYAKNLVFSCVHELFADSDSFLFKF